MYVEIGGIRQWIEFAEPSGERPTLLYLHGGPGASSRPAATAWRSWEEHFTVVHWDQRGAGRTFGENGEAGCGALTIDRMVEDGLEVVAFLRGRLRCDKIVLMGHSWGSVLAIHMIKRRADLFSAYVGTGQVVSPRENEECNYRRQLAQAQRSQNAEALRALVELGPPPYRDSAAIGKLRELADRLADGDGDSVAPMPRPLNPQFTAADRETLMLSVQFSRRQLFADLMDLDLPSLGPRFDIPIFFFEGMEDQQTSAELAEAYFNEISAPHKEFVRFEGCHHFVVFNRPDDFLRELVARVLPWVRSRNAELEHE
ncbi:alpha/beta fold hydrolase [Methylosinus sp. Sm6]|uniref:alpha/beta fold hydrolase n=1 Tax=Methylosinus sp. Sm6 TaxID=2866948 RepID=UPI001C991C24|nr:alpha/beta hydrolase [Methylosinus sp. Sm6]MBY6239692.1 alpha/beta hydrolase [Methylosinus sp. Sm6]